MVAQAFSIEVAHVDGGVLVALIGELDVNGVPHLQELQQLSSRYDLGQLTFSCDRLVFMDAAGLGALLDSLRWFGPEGKPRVEDLSPPLELLFVHCQADAVFELGNT